MLNTADSPTRQPQCSLHRVPITPSHKQNDYDGIRLWLSKVLSTPPSPGWRCFAHSPVQYRYVPAPNRLRSGPWIAPNSPLRAFFTDALALYSTAQDRLRIGQPNGKGTCQAASAPLIAARMRFGSALGESSYVTRTRAAPLPAPRLRWPGKSMPLRHAALLYCSVLYCTVLYRSLHHNVIQRSTHIK